MNTKGYPVNLIRALHKVQPLDVVLVLVLSAQFVSVGDYFSRPVQRIEIHQTGSLAGISLCK